MLFRALSYAMTLPPWVEKRRACPSRMLERWGFQEVTVYGPISLSIMVESVIRVKEIRWQRRLDSTVEYNVQHD